MNGATLKRKRTEAGQTLTAIAESADIDKGLLSRLENGYITVANMAVHRVIALARAYGIPFADFIKVKATKATKRKEAA